MAADTGSDAKREAAFALHRFGLGPREGSLAAIAADPRGALIADLSRPGAGRLSDPDLLTSAAAARAAFDFRQERKAARLAARAGQEATETAAERAARPGANPAAPANPVAGDKMANGDAS